MFKLLFSCSRLRIADGGMNDAVRSPWDTDTYRVQPRAAYVRWTMWTYRIDDRRRLSRTYQQRRVGIQPRMGGTGTYGPMRSTSACDAAGTIPGQDVRMGSYLFLSRIIRDATTQDRCPDILTARNPQEYRKLISLSLTIDIL
jgi:hypothetical protein